LPPAVMKLPTTIVKLLAIVPKLTTIALKMRRPAKYCKPTVGNCA
jgi:hypothetical protein